MASDTSSIPAGSDFSSPDPVTIRAKLAEVAFGSPVVQNDFRGVVSEIIVGFALAPEWKRCSENWSGWDFQHASGCRLEIKQSAALQTWAAPKKPSPPRFDIGERSGYYFGAEWVPQSGRHAQIYVFAYHPVSDDRADHCDSRQWEFHVVATSQLPPTKSISLNAVTGLSAAVRWSALRHTVEQVHRLCGF